MSKQDAENAASEWLGTLRLGRNLAGQTIDLTPHLPSLKAEGVFRTMVLQAVVRKLVKRGIRKDNIIGVVV